MDDTDQQVVQASNQSYSGQDAQASNQRKVPLPAFIRNLIPTNDISGVVTQIVDVLWQLINR